MYFASLIQQRMKSNCLIILFSVLLLSTSSARQNDSTIIDNDLKLQFTAPGGWSISKADDMYILKSPNNSGFMLIEIQNLTTLKSLKTAMEKGTGLHDGTIMMPLEELTMLGNRGVSGLFGGKIDDEDMTGFLMALLPPSRGKSVVCISVAPQNFFNQSNLDQLKILLRSVIFL